MCRLYEEQGGCVRVFENRSQASDFSTDFEYFDINENGVEETHAVDQAHETHD